MELPSDQNMNRPITGDVAKKMDEFREEAFSEWEKQVRESIPEATRLAHPILINTLPAFYDNLIEALTPGYPRTSTGVSTTSVAQEHGGERARLTGYDANAVIWEYQIFNTVLIELLKRSGIFPNDEEMRIITSATDACIRNSVTAFTLAQAAFREQFIAALAHDMRTPLGAALISAQIISRSSEPDKVRLHAEKVVENVRRVDHMVKEMLDTAIFQKGERLRLSISQFDIEKLVAEVREQSEAIFGPRFDVVAESITGWWSWDGLKRALENLINNSIKYGYQHSRIRISVKTFHGRVTLSVHNEGGAIPPDQVESIFQVFNRAKAAKEGNAEGWGIGLPFVRAVVESHGGSIDVDSTQERGTTFGMDFPIDARPFQDAPTLG